MNTFLHMSYMMCLWRKTTGSVASRQEEEMWNSPACGEYCKHKQRCDVTGSGQVGRCRISNRMLCRTHASRMSYGGEGSAGTLPPPRHPQVVQQNTCIVLSACDDVVHVLNSVKRSFVLRHARHAYIAQRTHMQHGHPHAPRAMYDTFRCVLSSLSGC